MPICLRSLLPPGLVRALGLAVLAVLGLGVPMAAVHAAEAQAPAPASSGAQAPAPASSGLEAGLDQEVRTLALGGTAVTPPPGVSRVEVVVGQLDPRLHLAPCQRVEPYLPNNIRLWGKTRIGLRCTLGPTRWNVYLPVTVKAYGPALVATMGAASGSILTAADLVEAEVDLAEDMTPAVVDAEQAIGRTLARPLKSGQTLRQGHIKARQWFAAGDTVKVVALGEGFSLESEGQALSNGIEGQPARVRTESGHVLTGRPIGERRLELLL